jgi:hypothetical protein
MMFHLLGPAGRFPSPVALSLSRRGLDVLSKSKGPLAWWPTKNEATERCFPAIDHVPCRHVTCNSSGADFFGTCKAPTDFAHDFRYPMPTGSKGVESFSRNFAVVVVPNNSTSTSNGRWSGGVFVDGSRPGSSNLGIGSCGKFGTRTIIRITPEIFVVATNDQCRGVYFPPSLCALPVFVDTRPSRRTPKKPSRQP